MFMKNKILFIVCLFCFIFIAQTKVLAYEDNETVDKNKIWTVKFTEEVGFDEDTKNAIIVTDKNNKKVNVTIQPDNDLKCVKVLPPKDGYREGENYILTVGKKSHSKKKVNMKKDRILHFKIKEEVIDNPVPILITQPKATVNQGDYFVLPKTVKVNYSDGSVRDVNAIWDKQADTSKVGTFDYEGKADGISFLFILTVNLKEAINENYTVKVENGPIITSSQKIQVTLSSKYNSDEYDVYVDKYKAEYKDGKFSVVLIGYNLNENLVKSYIRLEKKSSIIPTNTVTKNNLPFTYLAKNNMSITINSFSASGTEIILNVTLKNNSSTLNKGDIMTSTYNIFDGKSTLRFISQDKIFYDTDYLRAGQSITGNITFQGLSKSSDTFTLNGSLWQYIDSEKFNLIFKTDYVEVNPIPPVQKDLITQSDLPYTYKSKNNMSITINKYCISSNSVILNVTIKNNSSSLNTGQIMTTTYKLYDGKSYLKFISQDDSLWNNFSDLRAGQLVSGNIVFEGLTQDTDKVTLIGSLWQAVSVENFEMNFKN